MNAIRVLLADDHAITRFGLRTLLEMSGCEVVGEVSNGQDALQLSLQLSPDIVVMDIAMPGLNGIEATQAIRTHMPDIQIVILSMHRSAEHIYRAQSAGALGYLLKDEASEEIVAAIRTIRLGRRYLGKALTTLEPLEGTGASPLDNLSKREREVLQLVVEGNSSARIAAMTHLSPKSVDTYRSRLMQKLGVSDVTGLVKFAIEHHLTPGL